MVDVIVSLIAWLVLPVVYFVTSALVSMLVLYVLYYLYKFPQWLLQKDRPPYKEWEDKEINNIAENDTFIKIVMAISMIVVINHWVVLWSKQPLF